MSDGPGLGALRPGHLLVANPLLPDPNFDRTVVMVLAYGEEGALGVVLNRPTAVGSSMVGISLPAIEWTRTMSSSASFERSSSPICLPNSIEP